MRNAVALIFFVFLLVIGTNSFSQTHGPTIAIEVCNNEHSFNPIEEFMYFVPLTSPVSVRSEKSEGNTQHVRFLSHKIDRGSRTFTLKSEFQVTGEGYCKIFFDPQEVIVESLLIDKRMRTLKNLIEYIRIDGAGYGQFDVSGKVVDGKEVVDKVKVSFNGRNHRSLVTVGVFSVKPVEGKYNYEDRYDVTVARVNALTFTRSENEKIPKMGLEFASIGSASNFDGFLGKIRGFVANLLVPPVDIEKDGNQSVLNFAANIVRHKPSYTFPIAKNLKAN